MPHSYFPKTHVNLCLFLISIDARSSWRCGTPLVEYFFFFKLNIALTLFEGLNSGTFTDEIIPKIISSDKSCYGFEEKQFKFASTQKVPHKKIVNSIVFQRRLDPKCLTDIQWCFSQTSSLKHPVTIQLLQQTREVWSA